MGTLVTIFGALVGAIVVCVGLVNLADRLARRRAEGDGQLSAVDDSGARKTSRPPANQAAKFIRLLPSPKRDCLLAWRAGPQGTEAGLCDCLRGDVTLWSADLKNPLFLAVTDEGCAALLDRDRETKSLSLQLLDMAGVSRYRRSFATDLFAWGTTGDGNHLWCVSDPVVTDDDDRLRLLVFAINQGLLILEAKDPRESDEATKNAAIARVEIDQAAVALHLESGKVLQVSLGKYSGVREKPACRVPEMAFAEA